MVYAGPSNPFPPQTATEPKGGLHVVFVGGYGGRFEAIVSRICLRTFWSKLIGFYCIYTREAFDPT